MKVSYTACIADRKRAFDDDAVVTSFVDQLRQCCEFSRCKVPLYTFMPDHLHAIIEGSHEDSNTRLAFDRFKRMSGLWFRRNLQNIRWQKGYFDHVLRDTDDWRHHAAYVYNNPVRAGLVVDPGEFDHTGSIGYELGGVIEGLWWSEAERSLGRVRRRRP